jgi:hypothetical protein
MHWTRVLAWAACVALATSSMAAEPEVYPAKGQTAEQQERDQYACHEWATKETGVDPVTLAEEKLAAPTPAQHEGNAGGMARSAGIGAMGGAMEGDAGAGAMRGIGIGRMISVIRAKRQLREQQSADAQEASALQAQLDKYDRAYAACLTGRGYVVK